MTFEETDDVVRWRANVSRGSPLTGEVYFRRLRGFCDENGLSPDDLVKQGKNDLKKVQDLLEDNVTRLEKEGKAGSYI